MIRSMTLATPQNGGAPRLVEPADMGAFNASNVGPCHMESVRVLDVAGELYVLHAASSRGPLPLFDAPAALAEEDAEDAAIASLPAPLREKFCPGWKPIAVRRAKRALDDAEADLRAGKVAPEDVEPLRAALASAELTAGIVDAEPDRR
jgi:hypothetical protein